MKSKISFFNKTIFIKNILQCWPVWSVYLIVLFFAMPLSLFRSTRPSMFAGASDVSLKKLEALASCVTTGFNYNILFVFALSAGLAVLVFRYLFHVRSCYMMHTLPVRREELFYTCFLSGFLSLAIPQIVTFLLSLIVCIINNVTCVEYLLYWLLFSLGASFLFFCAAVFCCMLTGNLIAALVYYCAGNLIYVAVKYLILNIVSTLTFGMAGISTSLTSITSTKDSFFSPIAYLYNHLIIRIVRNDSTYDLQNVEVTGGKILICYLVPALVMISLSVIFYKKRQLECTGDIVTFSWMKPVFRWIVAFCAGTGLALIVTYVLFYNAKPQKQALMLIAASTVIAFFSFILSEMILQKRFRIFTHKRLLEAVICAAFTCFILAGLETDLFHLERRVPKADSVASALLESDSVDLVLTDTDDIQKLTGIHRAIIADKKAEEAYYYNYYYGSSYTSDEDGDGTDAITSVTITYYLKNGDSLSRSYDIETSQELLADSSSVISEIYDLQNDPTRLLQSKVCVNYEDVLYSGGTLDMPFIEDGDSISFTELPLTSEEAETIYAALQQDIMEGNYPIGMKSGQTNYEETYANSLSLVGYSKKKIVRLKETVPYRQEVDSDPMIRITSSYSDSYLHKEVYPSFTLYRSCTHTIQALIDTGIIESADDLTTWAECYEEDAAVG